MRKVALIIGATGMLGSQVCNLLMEEGIDIVLHYFGNEKLAAKIQEKANLFNVSALQIQADITSEEQVKDMFAQIKGHYRKLDYMINCSGIVRDKLLVFMSLDDWQSVIDINLKGTFLISREAIRLMIRKKAGGRIVNVSSGVAITGNIGQSNYAAAKAGIIAFTKSVAMEYSNKNIYVNSITTGAINGGMAKEALAIMSPEEKKDVKEPQLIAKILVEIVTGRKGNFTGENVEI